MYILNCYVYDTLMYSKDQLAEPLPLAVLLYNAPQLYNYSIFYTTAVKTKFRN